MVSSEPSWSATDSNHSPACSSTESKGRHALKVSSRTTVSCGCSRTRSAKESRYRYRANGGWNVDEMYHMLNQYWHAVARVFPTPGNKTSLFAPRPRRRDCRHGPSWTPSPTRARKSTEPSSRSTSCCLNRSAVGPLGSRNSARQRRVAGTPKNRAPRYPGTHALLLTPSRPAPTSHAQRLTPREGARPDTSDDCPRPPATALIEGTRAN